MEAYNVRLEIFIVKKKIKLEIFRRIDLKKNRLEKIVLVIEHVFKYEL